MTVGNDGNLGHEERVRKLIHEHKIGEILESVLHELYIGYIRKEVHENPTMYFLEYIAILNPEYEKTQELKKQVSLLEDKIAETNKRSSEIVKKLVELNGELSSEYFYQFMLMSGESPKKASMSKNSWFFSGGDEESNLRMSTTKSGNSVRKSEMISKIFRLKSTASSQPTSSASQHSSTN